MADEKIKISWEEVQSPEVDVRIKQQQMLGRAQEHYQQQAQQTPSTPVPSPLPVRSGSMWYNSILYMTIFGLVGGLVGWAAGEIAWLIVPNQFEQFGKALAEIQIIANRAKNGEITQDQAKREVESIGRQYKNNPYIKIISDQSISEDEKTERVETERSKDEWRIFFQQMLWFCSLGIPLAFFLAIGDQAVGGNWRGLVVNGSVGMVLGLAGSIVVGLFINTLYKALQGQEGNMVQQVFARGLGWAILGLFLSIAPGIVLKNWKRFFIGLAGGFMGGLLGGLLFDLIGYLTHIDVVSRLVGILAIGMASGLGTGLIEKAAKTGWLRVVAGLIAGKQFVIYKNPTAIGSSPQCEIYLFKDPQVGPRHAVIHAVRGGYEIEDLQSPSGTFVNGRPVARVRLGNNDQVKIGDTVLLFQEKPQALPGR